MQSLVFLKDTGLNLRFGKSEIFSFTTRQVITSKRLSLITVKLIFLVYQTVLLKVENFKK